MARPRIEMAGGTHHVIGKSPSGRLLFRDPDDRQLYLRLFWLEARERGWVVLTYCQMTNHAHVLVKTPQPDLGDGIKAIHETYARVYNERHREWGHVFGSRFFSELVRDDRHLVGCMRYIARNPVKAGICADAADWTWSAHGAIAGLRPPEPLLDLPAALETMGTDPAVARRRYVELVGYSEDDLLAHLRAHAGDAWLLRAVEDHGVEVGELAAFLQVSHATVYRRVAASRATEGTDP